MLDQPSSSKYRDYEMVALASFIMVIYWFVANHILCKLGMMINLGYFDRFPTPTVSEIILMCVFPALWEEALYRWAPLKIAQSAGQQYVLPVMIGSAISFGWSHGYGTSGIIFQGMMGFISGVLFVKTKQKYWSCVAFHMIWNLLVLFWIRNFVILEKVNL